MKNGRKTFILTEVMLGVMVLLLFVFMVYHKNGQQPEKIAVIVPDVDESQWSAFKYGLKTASQEYNVDIVVISKDNMETADDEIAVIEQEIAKGADAVIVKPIPDGDAEKKLRQVQKSVPVMLVSDTISVDGEESSLPTTQPEQYQMGVELAAALLEDNSGNLDGKTIGIYMETEDSVADVSRKEGVCDTLSDTGAKVLWCMAQDSPSGEERNLQSQRKVDIVMALDNKTLVETGQAAADNDLYGAIVYGIGNSTEAIYYLDTRWVECLVVPDEFAAGYESVPETVKKLRKSFYEMEDQQVSYTVLTRENLFSEENQELLFTISQ